MPTLNQLAAPPAIQGFNTMFELTIKLTLSYQQIRGILFLLMLFAS